MVRLMSLGLAIFFVLAFTLLVLLAPQKSSPPEEELTVRKIEMRLPPPPPPPPPVQQKPDVSQAESASINLAGLESQVQMSYTNKPKINTVKMDKIEQPEFELSTLHMRETLSVQFPVVGVKSLDAMPQIVSSKLVSIPGELRRRGITRVETKVQIIIVENGKAYIKKIVDPVYPEMVEPIREYIENIRFTAPTQDGNPVQAEYLFEMNFVYRT